MWRATVKGLLAHKLRLALTTLAIVLGVGFVVGTFIVTDTLRTVFDELFEDISTEVDVYVRSGSVFEGSQGFSSQREPLRDGLVDLVGEVEGVRVAEGGISGYAQLVAPDGEPVTTTGAPTLGVTWTDSEMNPMRLRSGRGVRAPDEIVIDSNTAAEHGFEVSDRATVLLPGPPEEFTIVGIAGFGDADNLAGATLVAFDLSTAQRVYDREGRVDEISVAGEEGVETAVLRERIASILPEGVEAVDADTAFEETSEQVEQGLSFFNTGLLIFGVVALFVGAFMIFNTFSIIVVQRTREFGLLRALGAGTRQVMSMVVVESAMTGAVASALGLAVGVGMAVGIQALLDAFGLSLPDRGLVLAPRTIVVAFAVGIAVTVAAAVVPARRAARIPPVAALREAGMEGEEQVEGRLLLGAPIATLGLGLLALGLTGDVANGALLVGLGALVMLLGVGAASPAVARPVAGAIGWPVAKILRLPGRLARDNAVRNPKRTAATAAALMIGLALVTFVAVFAESTRASTERTLSETLAADFILNTGAVGPIAPISPELSERLDERPELGPVTGIRFGQWESSAGDVRNVYAADPDAIGELVELDVREGSLGGVAQGGVLVHSDEAEDLGVGTGDTLEMRFARTGPTEVPVAGVFDERRVIDSGFLVSLATHRANYTDHFDVMVLAKAAEGTPTAEAREVVEATAEDFPNVQVQDQAEFREEASSGIDQLLGLITALLGLAIVIALLGITNTLALSILERTREVGLLRAVGMSRRQVRSMVRWEAVVVALLGAALGVPLGLLFGWAVVEALSDQGISVFAVPAGQLVVYVVLAGLAGLAAALFPARRAARLNVIEAVTVE